MMRGERAAGRLTGARGEGGRTMASDRQVQANRKNAARSTGPRTVAGKAASSANALKHGFASPRPVHLPPSIADDLPARMAMWARTLGSVAHGEEWLLRNVAIESLRVDRCQEQGARRLQDLQVDALSVEADGPEKSGVEDAADPAVVHDAAGPAEDDDAPEAITEGWAWGDGPRDFPLVDTTSMGHLLLRYEREAMRMVLRTLGRLERGTADRRDRDTSSDSAWRGAGGTAPAWRPSSASRLELATAVDDGGGPGSAEAAPPAPRERCQERFQELLFRKLASGEPRESIDLRGLLDQAHREVAGERAEQPEEDDRRDDGDDPDAAGQPGPEPPRRGPVNGIDGSLLSPEERRLISQMCSGRAPEVLPFCVGQGGESPAPSGAPTPPAGRERPGGRAPRRGRDGRGRSRPKRRGRPGSGTGDFRAPPGPCCDGGA